MHFLELLFSLEVLFTCLLHSCKAILELRPNIYSFPLFIMSPLTLNPLKILKPSKGTTNYFTVVLCKNKNVKSCDVLD